MSGESGEFLDTGLHIVTSYRLAGANGVKIYLLDDRLVCLDHTIGHVNTEFTLSLQDSHPQLTLEDDLVLRRPNRGHRRRGVPRSQNIGDQRCAGHGDLHCQRCRDH